MKHLSPVVERYDLADAARGFDPVESVALYGREPTLLALQFQAKKDTPDATDYVGDATE